MTTKITIEASCSGDKEVKVTINDYAGDKDAEHFTLQDGESNDFYIYDAREISIREVEK